MLIISHDRYFINKLADRIFNIEGGTIRKYDGNYDYFLTHFVPAAPEQPRAEKPEKRENEYLKQKERAAQLRKLKAGIGREERRIEELEQEISRLNDEMNDPQNASDYELMMENGQRLTALEEELSRCYERWEQASSELEELL